MLCGDASQASLDALAEIVGDPIGPVLATRSDTVDLHAVGMAARAAGTEASYIGRDGFHPSTAGHARVAEAFAEVLKASGPLVVNG